MTTDMIDYRSLTREEELAALRAGDIPTLVNSQLAWVKAIARQFHMRCPCTVELDELIAAGNQGLLESVLAYDGSTRLTSFAYRNIRWKMFAVVRDARRSMRIKPFGNANLVLEESGVSPVDAAEVSETGDRMRNLVAQLPERSRKLVEMRYWQQMTVLEVSQTMHVTACRVRQLEAVAIGQLRALMEVA